MKKNRALGAVSTPETVINFMLQLLDPPKTKSWNILEPASAHAPFLNAFHHKFGGKHTYSAVEYSSKEQHEPAPNFVKTISADFLLWDAQNRFDLIIGNPPYGIIGNKSHYPIHVFANQKSIYKQQFKTWFGKYNIYGAFVEKAINLLAPNGQLLFVVPASWMLLDDFKLLRKFLSEKGTIEVYYLGRVFPNVQITAVILHFMKDSPNTLYLYDHAKLWLSNHEYNGGMIRFENEWTTKFSRKYYSTVEEQFTINFAARSPEIKAFEFAFSETASDRTPLLTGRNLKSGKIEYEKNYTNIWIQKNKVHLLRAFYGEPHLVIGHTKGAKVVAAYDDRCYAWREEFHLIAKQKTNTIQIMNFLNHNDIQQYTKTLYRDLIPHLTKSQLKRLPIPKI